MRKPTAKRPSAGKTPTKPKVTAPATSAAAPKPARPAARSLPAKPKDKPIAAEAKPDLAVKEKAKEKPAKAASKGRVEPLNFRVTADFRRAFKRAAAAQDCKKVELLERIFTEWSARNPA